MPQTGTLRRVRLRTNGKRRTVHSKQRRLREWLWWIWSISQPTCYFCEDTIPVEDILQGDASDGVLLHHLDNDRDNDDPENLVVAHRTCHREFHRNYEWNGKRFVKMKK